MGVAPHAVQCEVGWSCSDLGFCLCESTMQIQTVPWKAHFQKELSSNKEKELCPVGGFPLMVTSDTKISPLKNRKSDLIKNKKKERSLLIVLSCRPALYCWSQYDGTVCLLKTRLGSCWHRYLSEVTWQKYVCIQISLLCTNFCSSQKVDNVKASLPVSASFFFIFQPEWWLFINDNFTLYMNGYSANQNNMADTDSSLI